MRTMAAIVVAFGLHGAAPCQTVAQLNWLAGDWVQQADGVLTEEIWTAPRGGMMLGMSRASTADRVRVFEYVRILKGADGRLRFVAQPGGVPPTEFLLSDHAAQSVTFENAGHDFPTRIRYWREGERLMAEISGKDGANAMRWSYSRRR